MDSKIFKAYDIRGIYDQELDEKTAYNIGNAFVLFLNKQNPKIVLGRDNRMSSPSLLNALKRGLINQGAEIIDIGLATTPMMYFAVARYGFDAGINITASHNPKEYNGFKLVREQAIPISQETGLEEIKEVAINNDFGDKKLEEKVIKKNVLGDYINFNLFNKDFKGLKIIVDTANSVSGILIKDVLKNCDYEHIFSELDGNFPNHEPDPLKPENTEALKQKVIAEKADLGIAFDGDGDRIVFLDEKGEAIPSDLILALMASILLKEKKGLKVLYDVRSSNIVKETIESLGGIAIISRIGHSFIKIKMRQEDIDFGGERSSHFYSKDHYFFEAPFFVLFNVLKEMKRQKKPFSEIIKPFEKYFHSGEINFKTENKEKILEKIRNNYQNGKITEIDGLRIDFDDYWFLVRASNTEPILRLVVEAKTKELLEEKEKEIYDLVTN